MCILLWEKSHNILTERQLGYEIDYAGCIYIGRLVDVIISLFANSKFFILLKIIHKICASYRKVIYKMTDTKIPIKTPAR